MNKIGTVKNVGILFFVIALSQLAFAQEDLTVVRVYDSFEMMKIEYPESNIDGSFDSEYLMGSVKFAFDDNSYVTPSGVLIKVFEMMNDKESKLVNKVITDVKGRFYINYLPLGYVKIEVVSSKEVVCKKYFFLNENSPNNLESILIPIDKIERKDKQEMKYKKF